MNPRSTAKSIRSRIGWAQHPNVRSDNQLTLGERAADVMRNGMGSWTFVFCALAFLAAWMVINHHHGFDPYPFILLNLVLSCLAALQGAILLIAARRADQIASELANSDHKIDEETLSLMHEVHELTQKVHALTEDVHKLTQVIYTHIASDKP